MTYTTMVPIAMDRRHLWPPGVLGPQADRPPCMTLHLTPGRLRLRLPERRGDAAFARQAEQALARVNGVLHVRANPVTGSVLVRFDPGLLNAPEILMALESRGLIRRATRALPVGSPPIGPIAVRIGAAIGKELAKAVVCEAVGGVWVAPLLALL